VPELSEAARRTVVHRDLPPAGWDEYVDRHPQASVYHRSAWPRAVANLFRLESYFLAAHGADERLCGVLPLVRQKSLLFGDRLTSLPYFNYGGALGDDPATRRALMERAAALCRELGADQLEFRDVEPPPVDWPVRTDKVTMVLDLPDSVEALDRQLGSKLRSQVKRALREQPELRVGGAELLDDFYMPFCEVMHELGTPVYPRRFFEALLAAVPSACTLVSVRIDGQPMGAAWLVQHRHTMEIPWAATAAAAKPLAVNMFLYHEVLKLAVTRGLARFDFGRSTVDSGPYRFKKQWGARPVQLHWAQWTPRTGATGSETTKPPESGGFMSRATVAWSRLPLGIANRLGPLISPKLPW
jgi:FemAB-related protein (PEP-CTERM system-associated)